jgi:hypothetical protein
MTIEFDAVFQRRFAEREDIGLNAIPGGALGNRMNGPLDSAECVRPICFEKM